MKRIASAAAILLIAALLFSACGAQEDTAASAVPESSVSYTEPSEAENPPASQSPSSGQEISGEKTPSGDGSAQESSGISQPERQIEDLDGGESMEKAQSIETNVRYRGRYRENEIWFSFRTGKTKDAPYSVTLDNLTEESGILYCYLYDGSGAAVKPKNIFFDRN